MYSSLVSVVIPAYNQAQFLGDAIQSVLDQTYEHFEVIVVNDASPDNTSEVVRQFPDSRVRLIVHKENRGLPEARNTGMRTLHGEIISLLDADDLFHPEKLESHVVFLKRNPDIGVTYNARFNLNHSSKTIRNLWRPPLNVNLADFICGFPFSPSDMVLRREWAFRVNLFDEQYFSGGEDLDFTCRLGLAGCKFASINRALNFRRYHSGRHKKRLPARLRDYTNVLETTFNDSRCPQEVVALRNTAYTNHYLELSSLALIQEESDLAQEYLRAAVQLSPFLLDGEPCPLLDYLLNTSIADESNNHEGILQTLFCQLPQEISWLDKQYKWAVAQGYLLRGVRAILWGRQSEGTTHIERAKQLGAQVSRPFLRNLAHELASYETEFGIESAMGIVQELVLHLEMLGSKVDTRWLHAHYLVNQAFQSYRARQYRKVVQGASSAIAKDPKHLTNRGVLAILLRSLSSVIGAGFHQLCKRANLFALPK